MPHPILANRYEFGPLLGVGAAGSVYAGLDTHSGEKVAIKMLRSDLVASAPDLVERFRREGEALRRLDHPNIVKVLATLEENQQHYIVMEYVGGGSLVDLIRSQPHLPVERIISIGLELSDALSRAHYLEILHRDIKPSNILLTEDGVTRLTDFGLARLGNYPALTEVGSILGTFLYLSPEACGNQPIDERSDIWSFGVVLYEMLTGQTPFNGSTALEVIMAVREQSLPDPAWGRDDLPVELVSLVRKMLMKDPAARLGSARLVGAELEMLQKRLRRASAGPAASPSKAPPPAPVQGPAASKKIRVLIVDDHAVVRQGLRTFIDLQDDMSVVGEGANGAEAVELAARLQPDVILLDLVMPEMDGVQATAKIIERSPSSRVLILTSFGEDDKVFPAIRAGAQGYLLKDIHPDALVQALRDAQQGKVQLHPDIARKLMSAVAGAAGASAAPPAAAPAGDLTERELEVLRLIARGMNNREIAETMIISEKTVKTHVSNLLGKLAVEDRTQAAIWALKHGLGEEP